MINSLLPGLVSTEEDCTFSGVTGAVVCWADWHPLLPVPLFLAEQKKETLKSDECLKTAKFK